MVIITGIIFFLLFSAKSERHPQLLSLGRARSEPSSNSQLPLGPAQVAFEFAPNVAQ